MAMRLRSGFGGYSAKYLKNDLIAAVIVTAIAIPESLAFAAIVGLPLETGLYCALFAPIIFALLTSSRRVVVGADSATATLVAAGGASVAIVGTAAYTNAIAVLGLLTGIILLIMAVARLGFLAQFISKPVLTGFFAGIGVHLMITKLPEMLGGSAQASVLATLGDLPTQLAQANWLAVLTALTVVGVALLVGNRKLPGTLIGLAVGTALAAIFHLENQGVAFVGELPQGLPEIVAPEISWVLLVGLLPSALSIALVIIAQGTAVSRSLGSEHDEETNTNQDIGAFGAANIASALTQGFAINGSPPRSIAADLAGGRSQMVNIIMSVMIGLLLLFATGALSYIPVPALAAVVFLIGLHLVNIRTFRDIFVVRKAEFIIALIALVAVAILGVMYGVVVAVLASLVERLYRQYRPTDQVMLRDGELSDWASERITIDHRHSREAAGLLVYRFNGSIFFENAEYFAQRLQRAIKKAKKPVKYVILDAGAIDEIDYTAVTTLRRVYEQLTADDIQLGLSHVAPHLSEQLERFGVIDTIGPDNIFPTLTAAIQNYPHGRRDVAGMVKRLDVDKDQLVVIGGGVMEALGLRDTNDADMVVSDSIYLYHRDKLGWREYVQDNGKRILSHHGYHMMRRWLGYDLKSLLAGSTVIDGVRFMSARKLIDAKQRLGRSKDREDIALLRQYLRDKRQKTYHSK